MAAPPPTQDDRFYKPNSLLMTFGISSVIMLVLTIWMILADFGREWKGYQREFMQLKEKKFAEWITAEQEEVDADEIGSIKEKISAVQADLESKEQEILEKRAELSKIRAKENILNNNWRGAKAAWDVLRYQYEAKYGHYEAEGHPEKLGPEGKKQLAFVRQELEDAYKIRDAYHKVSRSAASLEAEIDGYAKETQDLEKELSQARGNLDRLEEGERESKFTLTKLVRSSPILDLADPVFKINQIVIPWIRDDLVFAQSQKVDRCTTCHLAIDKPGFENEANPFKTHPQLDVIMGTTSPHPAAEFGCTICHSGRGRASHFVRAAHTPRDKEQEAHWKKKYH